MKLMPRSMIQFRLFQMPCCGHSYCHVNPRFPNFCPECGERCYSALRSEGHTVEHWHGWLCQDTDRAGEARALEPGRISTREMGD